MCLLFSRWLIQDLDLTLEKLKIDFLWVNLDEQIEIHSEYWIWGELLKPWRVNFSNSVTNSSQSVFRFSLIWWKYDSHLLCVVSALLLFISLNKLARFFDDLQSMVTCYSSYYVLKGFDNFAHFIPTQGMDWQCLNKKLPSSWKCASSDSFSKQRHCNKTIICNLNLKWVFDFSCQCWFASKLIYSGKPASIPRIIQTLGM